MTEGEESHSRRILRPLIASCSEIESNSSVLRSSLWFCCRDCGSRDRRARTLAWMCEALEDLVRKFVLNSERFVSLGRILESLDSITSETF